MINLAAMLHAALAELHPMARVAAALTDLVPEMEIHMLAIGKGAPSMARGAVMAWESHITRSLIITSDDTDAFGMEVIRGGHPIPDERSVLAANLCLDFVARAPSLLVLVSGGASSLVCAPAPGVTLKTKQWVTRRLLESGAPVSEINVVRKHLSLIKGGGLARAAGDAPIFTLVMSDVVKGKPEDVGSGPSLEDRSTIARAHKIVAKWAPDLGELPFVKTGKVKNAFDLKVVVAPADLARAMSSRLRQKHYKVTLRAPTVAPVERVAKDYLAAAATMKPGEALVGAAEPSVKLPPGTKGRGGRSTHLATLVGRALPPGFVFGAFATDGVDGASGTAGAIVDDDFRHGSPPALIDQALLTYDTGSLHLAAGTALPEEPTGHNLADLHVLVRLHTP
jgi:hydroxypyruvate reductase